MQKAISQYGYYRQEEALESLTPIVREAVRRLGFREIYHKIVVATIVKFCLPGTCPVGQEVEMEDNYREVKKAEPCLKLIHMDQVEVEEIEWLFYPFIPYGKVTIIQGDPGEGKTTVVLQIIAKLTNGEAILSETSEGKSEEAGVEPINRYYYCDTVLSIAKRFGYSESKVKIMLYRMRKDLRVYGYLAVIL